jgi:hypothetical protein
MTSRHLTRLAAKAAAAASPGTSASNVIPFAAYAARCPQQLQFGTDASSQQPLAHHDSRCTAQRSTAESGRVASLRHSDWHHGRGSRGIATSSARLQDDHGTGHDCAGADCPGTADGLPGVMRREPSQVQVLQFLYILIDIVHGAQRPLDLGSDIWSHAPTCERQFRALSAGNMAGGGGFCWCTRRSGCSGRDSNDAAARGSRHGRCCRGHCSSGNAAGQPGCRPRISRRRPTERRPRPGRHPSSGPQSGSWR